MSGPHEGLPRTVFKGQFEPASFALVLSRKDIVLATELGREGDVPMPVANLAEQIVIEAMNRGGWGDRDRSITFRLQEEAAGVKVLAPPRSTQGRLRHSSARIPRAMADRRGTHKYPQDRLARMQRGHDADQRSAGGRAGIR
jgi:hypothetical protein